VADQRFRVEAAKAGIPEGDHVFTFEFTPTGKPDLLKGKGTPADIKLMIDGKQVGAGKLPVTIPLSLGLAASVVVGADTGSPVMLEEDYKPPFAFTGRVKKALVDTSGEVIENLEAKVKMYLARQ
jgi:arylsulfatase